MINAIIEVPINWSALYVGLKNDWVSSENVVATINQNAEQMEVDENLLVELNINSDDKSMVLKVLETKSTGGEKEAEKDWHLVFLTAIHESEKSINEKLEQVSIQWARFDYPEEWRPFIHYMPNEEISSSEEVYQKLLAFLALHDN